MALYGSIPAVNNGLREEHALYGLAVHYKNGEGSIYIADGGFAITFVATDFEPKEEKPVESLKTIGTMDGKDVVRWKHKDGITKEEHKKMLNEAEKESESGKVICLSDLMINSGM
jgi:hypothetical protein